VPHRFEQMLKSTAIIAGAELRGKSDRIDVSPDGRFVVAIDYKRSDATFEPTGTTRLQLPLYAEMAAEELRAESAGGLYLALTRAHADGRIRSDARAYAAPGKKWEIEPDAWRQLVDEARADAAVAIDGIRSGQITPPPSRLCPDWCDHRLTWR
jgi:RecB family exonuclease